MTAALLSLPLAFLAFDPDPARWIDVPVPPRARAADRAVWEYAAGYSRLEWRVAPGPKGVRAALGGDEPAVTPGLPDAIRREHGRTALSVDDGWLVGENHGEWGGSLSWASPDGKRRRKLSNDQIVAFFRLPDGIYAIAGLAHLGISEGSVLRVDRPSPGAPWRATKVATLPQAPFAAAVRRDGTALLVLLDRVSEFEPRRPLRTLLPDAPWWGLYPNSAVLSPDESRLFVGMRQYVADLDLRTPTLHLRVPTPAHLNRLSKDDERIVRAQTRR